MSFSIKPMPAHSIIIATLYSDFDPQQEVSACIRDLKDYLDSMPQPACLITMIGGLGVGSGDIASLLSHLTQDDATLADHPRLRKVIVVADDDSPASTGCCGLPATVARTLQEAVALAY